MSGAHDFYPVPELVEVVHTLTHGSEHGAEDGLLPGIMEHGLVALHIHTPEALHPAQVVYPVHDLSPSLRYPDLIDYVLGLTQEPSERWDS